MMLRWVSAGALAGFLLGAPAAFSAPIARLTLTGTVNFPDADPDAVPSIGPQPVTVGVRVLGTPGSPWTLSVIADSDLVSGGSVIPISNVSWTASPSPMFSGGVLSTLTPVLCGSGVSHTIVNATFSFRFVNSWTWTPGVYSSTATFTLAAP
jgi:hypothetical protein